MTATKVAYVRPTDGPRGRLTFPEGGEPLTYHAQNLQIQEGFYRVTFKYGRSVVFIDKLVPCPPSEIGTLRQVLRTIPRISQAVRDRLAERLAGLPDDEAIERLGEPAFLRGVPGIGAASAELIAKTVGKQSKTERDLLAALGRYCVEADVSQAWYAYLLGYFEHYARGDRPGKVSLTDLARNPYLLHRVQRDRRAKDYLKQNHNLAPGRKLSFDAIDEAVLKSNPKWRYHRARVVEYALRVVEEAQNDGHTVVDLDDVVARLRAVGIGYVVRELDDEAADEMSAEAVRRLASQSRDLENVRFKRADGTEDWGVCTAEARRWHDGIVGGLKALLSKGPLLSKAETEKQLRTALRAAGVDLTAEQKNALKNAFGSRCSTIAGGAGTGKTTVSQAYLNGALLARTSREHENPLTRETKKRTGHHVYVLAPTGVAAQRIRNGLRLVDDVVHPQGVRVREEVAPAKISHVENDTDRESPVKRFLKQGKVFLGTLHAFLGYRGGQTYLLPAPHPAVIFVDEMSMVDEEVLYHLLRWVKKCDEASVPVSVLFAGDDNQLPPVGPGFPFRDMMGNSYGATVPVTRLTEVKRQAIGSMIAKASQDVLASRLPPSPRDYAAWGIDYNAVDFAWHDRAEMNGMPIPELLRNYAGYLTGRFGSASNPVRQRDIQVILPLRNPSSVEPDAAYTKGLNAELQAEFARASGAELVEYKARREEDGPTWSVTFALGDKVVHTGENGYAHGKQAETINRGSIGEVVFLNDDRIEVLYPWLDRPTVYAGALGAGKLDLAYAITGHSSQGSEFDYALVVLPDHAAINPRTNESLVDRGWLYTAVTRGKGHLMLVASAHRVAHAVGHSSGLSRNTLLARELLRI